MKTKIALVLSAVIATGIIAVASAGPRGPMGGMGGDRMERIFDRLDLTDEQRQTVEGIMDSYRPQLRSLRDSAREVRKNLAQTDPRDAGYSDVVATASQSAAETASQLVTTTAAMRAELDAVLTDDQRAEAAELREEWRERRKDRRARWRDRFGGSEDDGEL